MRRLKTHIAVIIMIAALPLGVTVLASRNSQNSALSGRFQSPSSVFEDRKPGLSPAATTFTVTRADDIPERGTCAVGDCTLREAIIAANSNAGTDTIAFATALNGVPITLTQTGVDPAEDAADYGDLDILESVIITGNGSANTIIRAGATAYGGIDKIFAVNPNCSAAGPAVSLTMSGVTLENGHNAGPFSAVQFNHTGGAMDYCSGGGSATTSTLSLTDVIFQNNQVDQGAGGGLNVVGTSAGTTNVTITNSQFLNNRTIDASHVSTGAGANITLNTSALAVNVVIDNCTFDGNEAQASSGGGLQINASVTAANTGTLQIHNSRFTNNQAKAAGGGISLVCVSGVNGKIAATIDQQTVIKGNTSGAFSGTAFGGGIEIDLLHPNASLTISKTTIVGNAESAGATTKLGGGGIYVQNVANPTAGALTIQFSRIEGNTATVGSGLKKDNQPGAVTATNNWWGCSAGPSATPCDVAFLQAGSGTLTTSPFLRMKTTPSPATIIVNQSTALTSRLQDSTGVDTAASNLDVFLNTNATAGSPLPVNWSAVGGTLSSQQSPLQSSGGFAQVTATYTGTAALASNSATAKVDNDSTSGASNTALITVNKGNTTASITGQSLATTLTGQSFTVNFNAAPSNTTNSPTAATGNVTVSDGVNNCSGSINSSGNGSCSLTLSTTGTRNLTATYNGDSNFNASAASPALSHDVTSVATWTGATNTDWNTASNWSTGGVPGAINDVNIPAGALPNEPTIGAFSVSVVALTIGSGHTLTVNAGGSLTATGVTNLDGTFGGSGGSFTFQNLLVGNPSGAAITGNATVNGTLSLPSGDLNMGSFVLTQPNTTASTGTGDVVGTVRRTGAPLPLAALTYGNPLNTIGFTAAGTRPTQIDVNLVKSVPTGSYLGNPIAFPGAVQRTYTVEPTGGSGYSANMQLRYLTSELNGNTEATLELWHFIGASWQAQATSVVNTGNHTVSQSGITSFSPWTIAGPPGPTATSHINGRLVDRDGNGIEGAGVWLTGTQNRLTVTDGNGNYSFDNVDANGLYTVSPRRANFKFDPSTQILSPLGLQAEALFTGEPDGQSLSPLDRTEYFVRQQYLDFLGREPDEAGLNFWYQNIESCGADESCREQKRIDTSAAFILSIEFRATGLLVHKLYQAAYGDRPGEPLPLTMAEFRPDQAAIGQHLVVNETGWRDVLSNNQRAFVETFVQRLRFVSSYPTTMNPTAFVDQLFQRAGVLPTSTERQAAIDEFGAASNTGDVAARGRALQRVADNPALDVQELNPAFVEMEYFGYLRRDANSPPDQDFSGFMFWLNKLESFGGDYKRAEMVRAFLSATEYRGRFPR